MRKSCYNCKYLSDLFVAVCTNPDSSYRGDYMDHDDWCQHWEEGDPPEGRESDGDADD